MMQKRCLVLVSLTVALSCGCSSNGSNRSGSPEDDAGPSGSAGSGGATGASGAGGHSATGSGGANATTGGTPSAGAGGKANGAGGRAGPGTGGGAGGGMPSGGATNPHDGGADGPTGIVPTGAFFSPYKDTSINMNWNTNVISTNVSGSMTSLVTELAKNGATAVTLAFATGECGSENWAGASGAAMASTNAPLLSKANIRYFLSTGGASGIFSCASDAGFSGFVDRWMTDTLVGIDFDIEAGQSEGQIQDLIRRIRGAHTAYPSLRFSLTLATLANNEGATTAKSLGSTVQDGFNTYGDMTMAAVKSTLGFSGTAASWPSYVTVNLMAMDYGGPGKGVCVVAGGTCQMGQSAIQAAYNLHDKWGVPYANVELTPMIGVNDVNTEKVALADVDTIVEFAAAQGLAGLHYWSYDRDTDCAVGAASPTCSSMGMGYAGPSGYLARFLGHGM